MNTTAEQARPTCNGAASLSNRVRALRLPDGGGAASSPGRVLPWALCAVLLVVSAAFGYRAYRVTPAAPAEPPAPTPTGPAPPPAATVAVSGHVVLQAKGYVIPAHQVQVSPKVGGMILELHRDFLEGRFFKKDDVLAELEDVDYKADYEHAAAALYTARQRYAELTRSWPKEIEQAQRELDEAKANREQLYREMLRNERLIGTMAVPQREYEQAKFGHDAMARRVERLDAALWLTKEGPRKEKVEAARHDVEAAQADVDKASWRLENCKIRAPISGHILTKKAEKGNVVNPLAFNVAASLCEMANLADLEVDLSVQERDIAAVSSEPDRQPCTLMPEAYQNNEAFRNKHPQGYRGVVSRQMPIADRSKGAIQVRVKVVPGEIPPDEVGLYLKPDMSVLVSFFRMN
jgi:multidrug efflux pump subunit AcrA (membrane-fusion protein)